MKLVITYKDAEDNRHEDHLDTNLDKAYLLNEQQQEEAPNESSFRVTLHKCYEQCGCYDVEIKEG